MNRIKYRIAPHNPDHELIWVEGYPFRVGPHVLVARKVRGGWTCDHYESGCSLKTAMPSHIHTRKLLIERAAVAFSPGFSLCGQLTEKAGTLDKINDSDGLVLVPDFTLSA